MGQTYLIYACSGTNRARHLISQNFILQQLEAKFIKVILKKKLDVLKAPIIIIIIIIIYLMEKFKQTQKSSNQYVPRVVVFKVTICVLE